MLYLQDKAQEAETELAKAQCFVAEHINGLLRRVNDAEAAADAAQLETAAVRETAAGAVAAHERAAAEAATIITALQVRITNLQLQVRVMVCSAAAP